jgi:hypothetical protein
MSHRVGLNLDVARSHRRRHRDGFRSATSLQSTLRRIRGSMLLDESSPENRRPRDRLAYRRLRADYVDAGPGAHARHHMNGLRPAVAVFTACLASGSSFRDCQAVALRRAH